MGKGGGISSRVTMKMECVVCTLYQQWTLNLPLRLAIGERNKGAVDEERGHCVDTLIAPYDWTMGKGGCSSSCYILVVLARVSIVPWFNC